MGYDVVKYILKESLQTVGVHLVNNLNFLEIKFNIFICLGPMVFL